MTKFRKQEKKKINMKPIDNYIKKKSDGQREVRLSVNDNKKTPILFIKMNRRMIKLINII
jgi:hypothetical protein